MYLQRWHGWCHMKLQPSRRKSCVHHTTIHHVTSCKATYVRCMRVLAVTCHLHFWQNDWDLLHATVVTRGWNGYRNKSQHRKLTLEKKILLPLQQGFEPATFQSRVRRSNHWAIPAPDRMKKMRRFQHLNEHNLLSINMRFYSRWRFFGCCF